MPKVVNERYSEFLKSGTINLFTLNELEVGLKKASLSKFGNMGRAFLIALYYTGARPVELLQLKPTNFAKNKSYLTIQIPTAKKGRARMLSIPMNKKYVTELYKYATSLFDEVYIFYELASRRTRTYKDRKNDIKEYVIITDRVYYYIKRWLGLNPYFLRHSRMSSLSQNGTDLMQLQFFKGSKRVDSVYPYLHMSKQVSEKIARNIK